MRVYTIYHKASQPADILKHADEVVFVKEGFSWGAFFGQIFWLLTKRLWIASAIYLAGFVILLVLGNLLDGVTGTTILLGALIFGLGLEANDIRGYFLTLKGHNIIGIIEGVSLGACERQFFADLETSVQLQPTNPNKQPTANPPVISPALSDEGETAIGLFPKPGV